MPSRPAAAPATPLTDRVGLADAQRRKLEHDLESQGMLSDVVRWVAQAGAEIVSVTDQDEFTNDVVIQRADGLVLVYDCT